MQNRNLTEKDINKSVVPRYSLKYKDVLSRIAESQNHKKHTQLPKPFLYQIRSIGVGAHSIVYLIEQERSKCLFAEKSISLEHSKKIKEELIRQIMIHYRLAHPNIIQLYHFFCDQSRFNLIIQFGMESLFSYLSQKKKYNKTITQSQTVQIIRQILKGLSYLHQQQIVHADLKLQNVLIKNGQVKICDFGCAHKFGSQMDKQVEGTLEYLAPELIQRNQSTWKRDIWAVGIIGYELITGNNPFSHLSENQKWLRLLKFEKIQIHQSLSPEMRQFIQSTLCLQEFRLESQKILQLLLFRKYNEEQLVLE